MIKSQIYYLNNMYKMPTPPMSVEQIEFINDLYYNQKMMHGRDKLFKYVQQNHPDLKISRRQIAEFLAKQEVNQIHQDSKGTPKTFKGTIAKEPHNIIGIDLVDLSNFQRGGYKWLLNGVDLSTRYLYSVPLKSKSKKDVYNGFKDMYEKQIKHVKMIRSDNGVEFKNDLFKKFCEEHNIKQVFSDAYSPQSNGAIERFNGVLKKLLFKTIDLEPSFKWYEQDKLQQLVDNINKTQSQGTKQSAYDLEQAYKDKDNEVLDKAYQNDLKYKKNKLTKQMFEVGDKVRVYMPSDKEKSNHWSRDIYTVEKIYKPKQVYSVYEYKVSDFKDKFKEEELLKVDDNTQKKIEKVEKFVISKIVKPVIHNNTPSYEVAWKNYKGQNTIEPRDNLLEDVPKMINKYEKEHDVLFYQNKKQKKWMFKIER